MFEWFKRFLPRTGANRGSSGDSAPKRDQPQKSLPDIPWIPAEKTPWGVPVLDVRPITRGLLSMTENEECARNAISFQKEDGRVFAAAEPEPAHLVEPPLRYPIDRYLADGVLFQPEAMEDKWAVFLHRKRILFVRTWTRQTVAAADVEVADGAAMVTRIHGEFAGAGGDDPADPDFTVRATDYLLRTHALGEEFPAPLPSGFESNPQTAALWCMSCFGRMAAFATPHRVDAPPPATPLRTHSLLHIAVARGDSAAADAELHAGVPIDLLAKDGLAPLHWALASTSTAMAEFLLRRGSPVDVRSAQGATPLMNAVQDGSMESVNFLLAHGADCNARDARGFTALHRAAEMGKADLVRRLLKAGARTGVTAEGHTPLSLALGRKEQEVAQLLQESTSQ